MKRPGVPLRVLRSRAAAIASGEKSSPVTIAPGLAQERVSRPMWHWKVQQRLPRDYSEFMPVELDHLADRTWVRDEPRQVVFGRSDVDGHALVPIDHVGRAVGVDWWHRRPVCAAAPAAVDPVAGRTRRRSAPRVALQSGGRSIA